ncbi:hypothetical protein Ddye_013150 [Dipteronia dyeriana]|uniref:Uncharacterized protein n=1 Tax=Dipteronia dyeriana TaxID=168575 RepID=A0AAD9X5R8_9ROSI|nr:hypothetical protein Ddye_013150 [Dipteronia dyeriana]
MWTDPTRGMPGPAGIGGILRNSPGKFLCLFSFFVGMQDSNTAELLAIQKPGIFVPPVLCRLIARLILTTNSLVDSLVKSGSNVSEDRLEWWAPFNKKTTALDKQWKILTTSVVSPVKHRLFYVKKTKEADIWFVMYIIRSYFGLAETLSLTGRATEVQAGASYLREDGSEVVLTEYDLRFISFCTGRRVTLRISMTLMLFARLLQGFTRIAPPNKTKIDFSEAEDSLALAKPLIAGAKPRQSPPFSVVLLALFLVGLCFCGALAVVVGCSCLFALPFVAI